MTEELTQLARRFIADSILRAMPSMWLRRAKTFEDARPKAEDWHGHATAEDIAERDARLAEMAELCRLHARLLIDDPTPIRADIDAMVADVLDDIEQVAAA